jgi:hypothetical protein
MSHEAPPDLFRDILNIQVSAEAPAERSGVDLMAAAGIRAPSGA